MRIKNTEIYAMDIVIVAGTLAALVFVAQYARPLVIAPLDNAETQNGSVLFSIERGKTLLIDRSQSFSSPERIPIKDNMTVNLRPGTYYWKVEGVVESKVKKLIVSSVVSVLLRASGNEYDVMNVGNVETNVTFYKNDTPILTHIVPVWGNLSISNLSSNATLIVGRQNGE